MADSRRAFSFQREDSAEVFVESLFGHSKTDRKAGQYSSKQSRRKSTFIRRSFHTLPSAHLNMSKEEIGLYELDKMEIAELEQRRVDRFWGLDKEATDCQRERIMITWESERSVLQEQLLKAASKRCLWEEEERVKSYEAAYSNSLREGQARKSYMRSFYQATSSADVMFFNWPTRQHIRARPDKSNNSYKLAQGDIERMVEEYLRLPGSGFEIVDVLPSHSSVHLGGRQQAHSLSTVDADPASQGVARAGSTSVALKAMRPLDFRRRGKSNRVVEGSRSAAMGSSSSSSSPRRPRTRSASLTVASTRPGTAEGLGRETSSGPADWKDRAAFDLLSSPSHRDELDGHPTYKWDQVMIFRQVYSRLDGGDGGVDEAKLQSIRNDTHVLSLLRFTVLGVWVKRRQWSKFQGLLGTHSSISLLDLVQGARKMSYESRVSPRRVRTDIEHRESVLEKWKSQARTLKYGVDKEAGFKAVFAEEQRRRHNRACRDAFLFRSLSQGDCVWGLIGGAAMWLPAVVEMVNEDGTYDLSYPLTLAALQQAKVMATSRELLALPVQPSSPMLTPKSFRGERDVCAYAFDLIAGGSSSSSPTDVVDAQKLWGALRSPKFSSIVRSSAALSQVVSGATMYNFIKSDEFLALFLEEFADQGRVKKIDFIDYCTNLQEMLSETSLFQYLDR